MKPLFETATTATQATCPLCGHFLAHHCRPGSSGFWFRQGRLKRLVRCQHSAFAADERATCGGSCAVAGCKCTGMPAPKRKKKETTP
jgi:hypothetical protein